MMMTRNYVLIKFCFRPT